MTHMTYPKFYEIWSIDSYIITSGSVDQMQEEMEEKLEDVLGFYAMLEASEEVEADGNKTLIFYLHTDNEEDRTPEEVARINELGMHWDLDQNMQHEAICKALGITVHP